MGVKNSADFESQNNSQLDSLSTELCYGSDHTNEFIWK